MESCLGVLSVEESGGTFRLHVKAKRQQARVEAIVEADPELRRPTRVESGKWVRDERRELVKLAVEAIRLCIERSQVEQRLILQEKLGPKDARRVLARAERYIV